MNEQITSAAELDALPLTTIIRDANAMLYVRWPNTPNPEWWRPGSNVPETPRLPALALYRPDQPQPDPGEVEALRAEVAALRARIADMSWGLNPDRMGQ